jgi:hypothetical protein
MRQNDADFTLAFRHLSEAEGAEAGADAAIRALFKEPTAFDAWATRWRQRLAEERRDAAGRRTGMRAANPAFIPRNQMVAEAIRAAVDSADLAPFHELMTVLALPYDDQPAFARYAPEHHIRNTLVARMCRESRCGGQLAAGSSASLSDGGCYAYGTIVKVATMSMPRIQAPSRSGIRLDLAESSPAGAIFGSAGSPT